MLQENVFVEKVISEHRNGRSRKKVQGTRHEDKHILKIINISIETGIIVPFKKHLSAIKFIDIIDNHEPGDYWNQYQYH